jgi:acetyltransferase-like isoleucine patch superfamily enzyme
MKSENYLTMRWLREALRRFTQGVVAVSLFDFPGLMQLRLLALRSFFTIGDGGIIGKGCYFVQPHGLDSGRLQIGRGTRLNHRVEIDYSGGVRIGDNVWISQNVLIETHDHIVGPGPKQDWEKTTTPLEIADEAWIGANAIILPGVGRIGSGAIVGAGAVVTREVPDGAIVAGSPARIIRMRDHAAKLSPSEASRFGRVRDDGI